MKPVQKPEAAIRRCSTKQMFSTCAEVSFVIKVVCQPCNCIEKETPVEVFSCEFYEVFKGIYFTEDLKKNDAKNIFVFGEYSQ